MLCWADPGAQANTTPDNLLVRAVLATPDRHVLKHSEHKHKLPMHQNAKIYELHLLLMYPNTNNCVLHILLTVLNTNNLRRSGNIYIYICTDHTIYVETPDVCSVQGHTCAVLRAKTCAVLRGPGGDPDPGLDRPKRTRFCVALAIR